MVGNPLRLAANVAMSWCNTSVGHAVVQKRVFVIYRNNLFAPLKLKSPEGARSARAKPHC